MKNLNYFFVIFLLITTCGLTSCDNEDEQIYFYSSAEKTKVTKASVSNVNRILLDVKNPIGSISIKSENEQIATVSISSENSIVVYGQAIGSTNITVTDSKNNKATIKVTVYKKELSLAIEKHLILVEAENATTEDSIVINNIKSEITNKLQPEGGEFRLTFTSKDEGDLVYIPDLTNASEKITGTFKFNLYTMAIGEDVIFQLNYNNQEYIYTYPYSNQTTRSDSYTILDFIRDFTSDYANITKPKITKAIAGLALRGFL